MLNDKEQAILQLFKENQGYSSSEIHEMLPVEVSLITVKRTLKKLVNGNYLQISGAGKATKYRLSPRYHLLRPIDMNSYYSLEMDDRSIKRNFRLELITNLLSSVVIFTKSELDDLNQLHETYRSNISQLSDFEKKNELERLAIDLSWKSAQIEGNTYSLLETERLLKERQTAQGKTRDEATMLLNHKEAIDFIVAQPDYLNPLSVARIEDVHLLLMKQLEVPRNIRKRRVGISGTNYRPLDNEFQIREALEATCDLVNKKENIFEKALLILVLISYIQPFVDGNKRTARILSNAVLLHFNYCPLSFRTVDSIDYKKAMLLFYEQHNMYNFKKMFIDQFEFAVNTYF